MKTLGIDLPSFGDPPAATGGFSVDDLTDFAKTDVFNLLEGPDDGEPDVETLIANAAAEARDQGYAEGVEAGKAETLAGIESALLARMEEALNSLDAIALDLEADRLRFLQSVFGALLPSVAERGFPVEAAAALEKAVRKDANAQSMSVKIFCPAGTQDALQSVLQSANDQSKVDIREDSELTGASLRMAWREGGLDLDINRAIEAVMEALSPYAGEPNAENFEQEVTSPIADDEPAMALDLPTDEEAASDEDFAIEPALADASDRDADTDAFGDAEIGAAAMDTMDINAEETPSEEINIDDAMAEPAGDFEISDIEDADDNENVDSVDIDVASIELDDISDENDGENSDNDDEIDVEAFEPMGGMEIIEDLDDGEETS